MDINQGVDIDVYSLIHLADDAKERKKQYRRTMVYMLLRVNEPPRNHRKIYYYGGKIILGMISNRLRKRILQKLKSYITSFQGVICEDSYVVNGNIEVMKQVLSSKWFDSAVDHQFEDSVFLFPSGQKNG